MNNPHDLLNDETFRAALDERNRRLWSCIDQLQPVPPPLPQDSGPPQGTYDPDQDANIPPQREKAFEYLHQNWELLTQFGDPSVSDVDDLRGNLYNTQHKRLNSYIPADQDELNSDGVKEYDKEVPENQGGGLRGAIYSQIGAWTGEPVAVMRWRIGDLLTALSWQIEIMESLRGAMDMYRALLGASRAKVLDICDNTIRVLEGNAAEAENEVGAFLADAGDRIGKGLSQLDFTSYVGEVAVEGPKAAVTGLAKDVVGKVLSGVAGAVVEEINEPASSDPMPPLESMIDSVRKLRAATQGDSDRIAGMVDDLSEYVAPGGAHYQFLIHEDGESAPPYPYGTGTGISDGASYVPAGIYYVAKGILPPVAEAWRSNQVTMEGVTGPNAFLEHLPTSVGAEHMFLRLRRSWFRVRSELTAAMGETVDGIAETSRRMADAAAQLESNELVNVESLNRLGADLESVRSPVSQKLDGETN
ncbi:hypothetical protein ACPZ19_05195 [Amycolatopsis lurida]